MTRSGHDPSPIRPERLAEDFGSKSEVARQGVLALYRAVLNAEQPSVHAAITRWKTLLANSGGPDMDRPSKKIDKLAVLVRFADGASRSGGRGLRAAHVLRGAGQTTGGANHGAAAGASQPGRNPDASRDDQPTFPADAGVRVGAPGRAGQDRRLRPPVARGLSQFSRRDKRRMQRRHARRENGTVPLGRTGRGQSRLFGQRVFKWLRPLAEKRDSPQRTFPDRRGRRAAIHWRGISTRSRSRLPGGFARRQPKSTATRRMPRRNPDPPATCSGGSTKNSSPKSSATAWANTTRPTGWRPMSWTRPATRASPIVGLLDPACGSGVFLMAAIQRIRDAHAEESAPRDLGRRIRANVAGFDLNPLAVMAARAKLPAGHRRPADAGGDARHPGLSSGRDSRRGASGRDVRLCGGQPAVDRVGPSARGVPRGDQATLGALRPVHPSPAPRHATGAARKTSRC